MEQSIPEATNIKAENADGTQFSAEINGKRWSGIREGSTDWKSIMVEVEQGNYQEYVERVDTPAELAAKELAELDATMPRYIEELLDVMPEDQRDLYLAKGTKIEGRNKGWVKDRKSILRGKL